MITVEPLSVRLLDFRDVHHNLSSESSQIRRTNRTKLLLLEQLGLLLDRTRDGLPRIDVLAPPFGIPVNLGLVFSFFLGVLVGERCLHAVDFTSDGRESVLDAETRFGRLPRLSP